MRMQESVRRLVKQSKRSSTNGIEHPGAGRAFRYRSQRVVGRHSSRALHPNAVTSGGSVRTALVGEPLATQASRSMGWKFCVDQHRSRTPPGVNPLAGICTVPSTSLTETQEFALLNLIL